MYQGAAMTGAKSGRLFRISLCTVMELLQLLKPPDFAFFRHNSAAITKNDEKVTVGPSAEKSFKHIPQLYWKAWGKDPDAVQICTQTLDLQDKWCII